MDNSGSKDISGFTSLSKEELELEKLRKEVYLLEEQIKDKAPKSTSWLDKTLKYFQNNIGKILAIGAIIGAVVNPVLNYIGSQRKAHLIGVSNDMFNVLDSAVDNRIEKISTQDPNLIAPYLLNLLSDNKIKHQDAFNIYVRMYKLNTDLSNYSLYDRVLFLFIKSNKSILEDELSNSATKAFNKILIRENDSQLLIIRTFIDIIYELKLEEKKRFKKELNILRIKCNNQDTNYRDLCEYLIIKSKLNEAN